METMQAVKVIRNQITQKISTDSESSEDQGDVKTLADSRRPRIRILHYQKAQKTHEINGTQDTQMTQKTQGLAERENS